MVRTILLAWSICLVPLGASAADAIWFNDAPGQTLYVRVRTSSTASVAAALTEGTSNGVGFYVVSDAALVTAGLTTAATYPYKIFVGAPSTSADDLLAGMGVLAWSGSAAMPASSNVTQISGDATAADNLEAYSDGTTPQPVNVTQFGGTNGTFSGGRPEVNTTHWGGTAVGSATVGANLTQLGGSNISFTAAGVAAANFRRVFQNNEDALADDVPYFDHIEVTFGNLAIIDGILDNIFTAFELDGAVYRLTANALEQAP